MVELMVKEPLASANELIEVALTTIVDQARRDARHEIACQLREKLVQGLGIALRELELAESCARSHPLAAARKREIARTMVRELLEFAKALTIQLRASPSDGQMTVSAEQPVALTASPLSRRETEVLELAAAALSNIQIGNKLRIAEGTVKRHLTSVYSKLGADSRIDAINKATAAGLIRRPSSPRR